MAALVTAYGRRALFRGLVKCGKRALYCDTDSIVYISDPRQRHREPYIDPHGLLGNWVNELKAGQFIRVCHPPEVRLAYRSHSQHHALLKAFVATAPKCYQYIVCGEMDPLGAPVAVKCRMKGEPSRWKRVWCGGWGWLWV